MKVLNTKVKESTEGRGWDQDGKNRLGTMSHSGKEGRREDHRKHLWRRRRCGKTQMDGKAWLLDDPFKVQMSWLLNTTMTEEQRLALLV